MTTAPGQDEVHVREGGQNQWPQPRHESDVMTHEVWNLMKVAPPSNMADALSKWARGKIEGRAR